MPDNTLSPAGAGLEFMEQTKYRNLKRSDQEKGLARPPLELPPAPGLPVMDLPKPATLAIPHLDLRMAIERRHSVRSYAKKPLSVDELSFLLWCTQGVKKTAGTYATFRTVPSAGARHAFETYLLVNDVDGLDRGLYRYLALTHRLQSNRQPTLRCTSDRRMPVLARTLSCGAALHSSGSAVPYRMTWRYGERGYRELHNDAGHVCQNLYLAAEAVGCGVCAIAAFDDDAMAEILGIDGEGAVSDLPCNGREVRNRAVTERVLWGLEYLLTDPCFCELEIPLKTFL